MTRDISPEAENQILKSHIAALEQLIEVYEKSVLENLDKLHAEISRRKDTEETLQTIRLQLSEAMELARIVYWEVDTVRDLFILNDAFYAFYGTTAEREGGYLIPMEDGVKRFVHPEDILLFYQTYEKMNQNLDREFLSYLEHRIVRMDGEVRYTIARARIIKDDDSRIIRIYGTSQDITERKQAEDALKENVHFQQTLIDAIPNPVFYKNAAGVYQGCNKAFEDYIGLKKSDLIGKSVYEIAPRGLADWYHEMDMSLINQDQSGAQTYEASVRYTDGTIHEVIFNKATYINSGGGIAGLVGVILDITERKKMEETLRKLNDDLEQRVAERTSQLVKAQEELVRKEKLAILGQLAGTVGHEIRNPLGVMSNAVYFLKTLMPDANDTVKEYLDIIRQEIGNSLRIITDLLDFARTRPPHVLSVGVAALINQAMDKCNIPENIAVDIDIPKILTQVWVDPDQIKQVFQNLITNAVQAMPEDGALRISVRKAQGASAFAVGFGAASVRKVQGGDIEKHQLSTSDAGPDKDYIEISIEDKGAGISPEDMKKLFQPLFTTKPKGIGLGLVVCKNLVEANGGRITVESVLGKGTTFVIMLPINGGNE